MEDNNIIHRCEEDPLEIMIKNLTKIKACEVDFIVPYFGFMNK